MRKRPVRHIVEEHTRGDTVISTYYRGSRRRTKSGWKRIVGRRHGTINRFLFNKHRRNMWAPIPEGIKSFIESFGDVDEVYIAGSFVTKKDIPKDIDVFILYPASKHIKKDEINQDCCQHISSGLLHYVVYRIVLNTNKRTFEFC